MSVLSVLIGASLFAAPVIQEVSPVEKLAKESGVVFEDIPDFLKFKFTFTDTKRGQVGFVRKKHEEYLSLKSFELFSIFYESKEPMPLDKLVEMSKRRFTIGGITYEEPSEKQLFYRARFRIDLNLSTDPKVMRNRMEVVTGTADSLEQTFSNVKEDVQ